MISFEKPICCYEDGDGFNDPITSGEEMCYYSLCDDMDRYPNYYEQEHIDLIDAYANASTPHEIDSIWAKIVEFMDSLVEG